MIDNRKGWLFLPEKHALAFIVVFALLAPFSFALENCADILYVSYSSSALMPLYGEVVSPGVAVVTIASKKPLAFSFGNDTADFFHIAAQDQYKDSSLLASAGEVFFRPQYGSGFNTDFFKRARSLKPVYVESGLPLEISFDPNYQFSYAGSSFETSVVKISYPKNPSFGFGNGAGKTIIALTKTLDPLVSSLKQGSIYIETPSGLVYASGGFIKFIGSCTPSCTDPDYLDYYQNTTCRSTLVDAGDYCLGENELIEFSCSSSQNSCVSQQFSCPYGCENGKCKSGAKAKCEDFDGLNIAVKGRATGSYANGTGFTFYEKCEGATKVLEYSCEDGKILKSQVLDCAGGSCENGACIPVPTTPACSDTDGGKDYETEGICSDSSGSFKDSCTSEGVKEYYCESGYCKSVVSPCPSCLNNACPKSELLPSSSLGLLVLVIVIIALVAFLVLTREKKRHGEVDSALKGITFFEHEKHARKQHKKR
ncbi:MAG: hypothetical protein V1717_00600 [Candidatus Micrarchaeota archaeon]